MANWRLWGYLLDLATGAFSLPSPASQSSRLPEEMPSSNGLGPAPDEARGGRGFGSGAFPRRRHRPESQRLDEALMLWRSVGVAGAFDALCLSINHECGTAKDR